MALLVSPTFIFWATEMRLIYQLVYKKAFDEAQFNHHRNAPAVSGPSGLPVGWATTMRSAVKLPTRKGGKPQLDPVVAKPQFVSCITMQNCQQPMLQLTVYKRIGTKKGTATTPHDWHLVVPNTLLLAETEPESKLIPA